MKNFKIVYRLASFNSLQSCCLEDVFIGLSIEWKSSPNTWRNNVFSTFLNVITFSFRPHPPVKWWHKNNREIRTQDWRLSRECGFLIHRETSYKLLHVYFQLTILLVWQPVWYKAYDSVDVGAEEMGNVRFVSAGGSAWFLRTRMASSSRSSIPFDGNWTKDTIQFTTTEHQPRTRSAF